MIKRLTLKEIFLSWLRLALLMILISGASWLVVNAVIKPILGIGGQ